MRTLNQSTDASEAHFLSVKINTLIKRRRRIAEFMKSSELEQMGHLLQKEVLAKQVCLTGGVLDRSVKETCSTALLPKKQRVSNFRKMQESKLYLPPISDRRMSLPKEISKTLKRVLRSSRPSRDQVLTTYASVAPEVDLSTE